MTAPPKLLPGLRAIGPEELARLFAQRDAQAHAAATVGKHPAAVSHAIGSEPNPALRQRLRNLRKSSHKKKLAKS